MFPATRYQGSKRKLVPWILSCLVGLEFDSAIDLFGGTAAVSYALKEQGKRVLYNDYLRFNHQLGLALIENQDTRVGDGLLEQILAAGEAGEDPATAPGFVARTFQGLYFTDQENLWLDRVVPAISAVQDRFQRAILWSALSQAALIKRPYNLFHRANLNMRQRKVQRSFGNKVTWDRPFPFYLRRFVGEFNEAVFDSGRPCSSSCADAEEVPCEADLVYLDPPYTNGRGGSVDYHGFYHFLEGLLDYDNWSDQLDKSRRHKPLRRRQNPWNRRGGIAAAFEATFARFDAVPVLAVSYRADGLPGVAEIESMLQRVGRQVRVETAAHYKYALSGKEAGEVLLVATHAGS